MKIVPILAVLLACAPMAYAQGNCSVTGVVVDEQGNGIAGADVYLEEGLGGPLYRSRSDANGGFGFYDIGTGPAGVFAFREGYAFGGDTVTLALGDAPDDVQLVLRPPTSLQGAVRDEQRDAVSGARIDRVAILGDTKYSVPLAKLHESGISAPISGSGGRFVLNHLPNSGTYALKVIHPSYAQEAVGDLCPGQHADITLYSGVLVRGEVLTRADGRLVAGAAIELRNAQPPHDTSITVTNSQGGFETRVKPGIYAYRATGSGYRSPAWQRLTLNGENPTQWIKLIVSRLGRIKGEVRDAASGDPLPGVRINMVVGGELSGVIRTGAAGAFDVEAASGMVDVKFEAPEGYRAPDRRAMRLTVAEDETLQLPTVWMAPIAPAHAVVQNVDGSPATGNVVRIVRPEQHEWNEVGIEGDVHFSLDAIPESGSILALAHHKVRNESALFTVNAGGQASQARLVPNGRIIGTVTNEKAKKISGAVVTIFYAEEGAGEPTTLWQGRTGRNGTFDWPSALARVPLRVVAHVPDEDGTPLPEQSGESAVSIVDSTTTFDVGNIVISGGKRSDSAIGDRMRLRKLESRCSVGILPEGFAIVAVEVPEGDIELLEALASLNRVSMAKGVAVVALVNWPAPCTDILLTLVNSRGPSIAKTYGISRDDRVVIESMAMPTFAMVRELSSQ